MRMYPGTSRDHRWKLCGPVGLLALLLALLALAGCQGVSSASNQQTSGGTETPGTLAPTQASLAFASVQVGLSQTLPETVTNSGASSVTISQTAVTGTGFSVSGLATPLTLTSGQSVTFNATFAPQTSGNASGNLSITSDASNAKLSIALSGTGTPDGQLGVTPTTWNFNNVVVGLSGNHAATLSATGASVTVTSVDTSSSEFAVSGLSLPATIPAGSSVPVTLTFAPQAAGAASGTAAFVSNASNSSLMLSLSGTGTPAPVHSVLLSWTASTSSNVTGYNIYRGSSSQGPFSQINPTLIASTSYTDNAVVDGQTYYYVATAINSSDQESAKSGPPQAAAIPAP